MLPLENNAYPLCQTRCTRTRSVKQRVPSTSNNVYPLCQTTCTLYVKQCVPAMSNKALLGLRHIYDKRSVSLKHGMNDRN